MASSGVTRLRQCLEVLGHDCVAVRVDGLQRNFELMRPQVEAWQRSELTDVTAILCSQYMRAKLLCQAARLSVKLACENIGPPALIFHFRRIWSALNQVINGKTGRLNLFCNHGWLKQKEVHRNWLSEKLLWMDNLISDVKGKQESALRLQNSPHFAEHFG